MDTGLTPREIQAKVRAGASVHEVAESADMAADRVEAFAAPVLAEREHIAGQARNASLRRSGESVGHQTVGVALEQRLRERDADPDAVLWDSYKMPDGRWLVSTDYRLGQTQRRAVFYYDPRGRFAVAGNDEAQWVAGDRFVDDTARETGHSPDDEPTVRLVGAEDELALIRAVETAEDADSDDQRGAQSGTEHESGPAVELSDARPQSVEQISTDPELAEQDPDRPETADADAETSTDASVTSAGASAQTSETLFPCDDPAPQTAGDQPEQQGQAADTTPANGSSNVESPAGHRTSGDQSTQQDQTADAAAAGGASTGETDTPSQMDLLYDMLGTSMAEDPARDYFSFSDAAAVPDSPSAPDFADETWEQPTDYPAEPEREPEQPDLFSATVDSVDAPSTAAPTPESETARTASDEHATADEPATSEQAAVTNTVDTRAGRTGRDETGRDSGTAGAADTSSGTAEPVTESADAEQATDSTAEAGESAGADQADTAETEAAPKQTKSRKRKRASVPSWDEIMFGAPKQK